MTVLWIGGVGSRKISQAVQRQAWESIGSPWNKASDLLEKTGVSVEVVCQLKFAVMSWRNKPGSSVARREVNWIQSRFILYKWVGPGKLGATFREDTSVVLCFDNSKLLEIDADNFLQLEGPHQIKEVDNLRKAGHM